jgi:hypothetical protein
VSPFEEMADRLSVNHARDEWFQRRGFMPDEYPDTHMMTKSFYVAEQVEEETGIAVGRFISFPDAYRKWKASFEEISAPVIEGWL